MKLAALNPPLLVKLLTLDKHAEHLAGLAGQAEGEVNLARSYLSGQRVDLRLDIDAIKQGFDGKLKEAKRLRAAADAEQKVLSGAKLFLEMLPPDSALEMVETPPVDGLQLDEVRARKQAIATEIRALRAVPVPSDDVEHRVRAYVGELARAGRPEITGGIAGGPLQVKWPNDFEKNALWMAACLFPDVVADRVMAAVAVEANKLLPPPQRLTKMRELEAELSELGRAEVALVDQAIADGDANETHDVNAPPEVVLGCRVKAAASAAA